MGEIFSQFRRLTRRARRMRTVEITRAVLLGEVVVQDPRYLRRWVGKWVNRASEVKTSGTISDWTLVDPMGVMSREQYEKYLENAERRFDRRFSANSCPKEKLENFEITGALGKGACATVYLAKRTRSEQKVALKVQSKNSIQEKNLVSQVIREKKLQWAIENKFIIKLFCAFQDSKNLYMILEFAAFGSLCGLVGLPENLTRNIVAQIVLAFEYLHRCSVIHRDLKPDNVLLFEGWQVKLSDFGLSKKIMDRTTTMVGCLPYLSPELHRMEPYGRDFDFWLLGNFIYELTYGKRAFYRRGWSQARAERAVLTANVRFPENVDSNSPVNEIIKALLAKKRCDRLGTLSGGMNDVKRHEWFDGLCFYKTFNGEQRMDHITIEPLQATKCKKIKKIGGTVLSDYSEFSEF